MRRRKDHGRRLISAVMLFYFSAFLLLFARDFAWQGLVLAVAVPVMIRLGTATLSRLFPVDRLLLSLTNYLCALGVLVLYDTDPARAYHQAVYYGIGLAAMVVCIYLIRGIRRWDLPIGILIPVSLSALILPLVFGREINGARNWLTLGGYSVQPSEFVKLALILVVSHFMSRRAFLPWLAYAVACLGILMLQADLGTALMYYGVTLLLYYASSSNIPMTLLGVAGGAGAAVVGYQRFAHVRRRVAIWRNPWVDYERYGYQIVQGLMAIASGGLFGVGLGLGAPETIPAYTTDYIFAVICEQFGLIFGLCVLGMYVAIIWRGATIAMASRSRFQGLVAMGCTLMIGLQTFTIIGGVLKLIPLTGVTLPFVSAGGSSMINSLCLTGLLQGVASVNDDRMEEDAYLTTLEGEELT